MTGVLCLNGPNLDRLGMRQPQIYGTMSLRELNDKVSDWGAKLGLDVSFFQTNSESEMIETLATTAAAGVLINPGALTHTSHALADAISGLAVPIVEVHLSNVRARDRWRRRSLISGVVDASIFGRGPEGYRSALRVLTNRQVYQPITLRYGPHPDQDFQVGGDGPKVAGLIHGGFWQDNWGRDTMDDWALALIDRGWRVANLEFRRMGSGGGAVATPRDILDALKEIRSETNADRLTLVGHSAGAHLAAWAAAHDRTVNKVIGLAGIYRLDPELGAGAARRFDPAGITGLERFDDFWGEFTLVHGDADGVVPSGQSVDFARRLDANAKLLRLGDLGHFELLNPASLPPEVFESLD